MSERIIITAPTAHGCTNASATTDAVDPGMVHQ
jgi:hypothetical protein